MTLQRMMMGAATLTGTTDPYFANVSLLLLGDGTNGSTTIIDSSPSPKTVTPAGNAQISTEFGGARIRFANTTDYLSVGSSQDFVFGLGDFTVEMWIIMDGDQNSRGVLGNRASGASPQWQILFYQTTNRIEWHTGSDIILVAGSTLSPFSWHHVAFARSESTLRLFIDGQLSSYTSDLIDYSLNNQILINRDWNSYNGSVGTMSFMDNIRITKGVARYTANFTPPTNDANNPYFANVSLLLHGNGTNGSTTIIDSSPSPKTVTPAGNAQISTAQSKFGGASIAFDGTGDYLSVPANSAFDFGSGNYTIEMWVYMSSASNYGGLISKGANATIDTTVFSLEFNNTSNVLSFFLGSVGSFGSYVITGTTNVRTSATWRHVAIARSGNNTRMFINGIQEGSTFTEAYTIGAGNNLWIGGGFYDPSANTINGFIDEVRIIKGVALYTANFTPPNLPFPDS